MMIRDATSMDARGIGAVLKECYNIASVEEGVLVFNSETAKGHHYIVAEDNGKIVGLTTWLMHGLFRHQLCELDRIAVLADYRGKGAAKALFDALVVSADAFYKKHGFKLRKLYLLTHADNLQAQRFYEKMGFSHETTLKSHYYDGKDEFVYSRFFRSFL
ncbi:MAG TPA: GNAT family N-acetyltransferase [Candidatus Nanoarchaeia archaeon]|nr:GNAT family N-acetyltransferase [Candidatus Nanoarchaeia archaeon]